MINPLFGGLLSQANLFTFEDFWSLKTTPFKKKKDREISLFQWEGKTFFLKRYFRIPLFGPSGAEREWFGAQRLIRAGLKVPLPVSLGIQKNWFKGRAFSLFLQAKGKRLEDLFLQEGWRPFLKPLVQTATRFHLLGFSHQDFYLCHFFWDEAEKALTIIDLQRLRWRKNPPRRWIIKDLAELFYSARQTLDKNEYEAFREAFLFHYARYLPWIKKKKALEKLEKKIARITSHDRKRKQKAFSPPGSSL